MKKSIYSRRDYLRQIAREKTLVKLTQILSIVAFLLLWEFCAHRDIIDPFILSSPSRILRIFFVMAQSGLMTHILYTVLETAVGFSLGVIIGFSLAVWLWFSDFAHKVMAPFLVVLNSLPKIALGPVIIVWAGAGMSAIIVMAVAISLIVTVLELSGGFAATDTNLLITVKSFGAGRMECFTKIVLPYNIPVLFQSLKVNIGLSLVGVIAGEFLVSKAGLGYLIVYAGQVFKMDLVMMSVILLGIIAFGMYSGVNFLEKTVGKTINHI
ncbi:MAG: ABC transporter permease [Oscillospiraceae bacterium]